MGPIHTSSATYQAPLRFLSQERHYVEVVTQVHLSFLDSIDLRSSQWSCDMGESNIKAFLFSEVDGILNCPDTVFTKRLHRSPNMQQILSKSSLAGWKRRSRWWKPLCLQDSRNCTNWEAESQWQVLIMISESLQLITWVPLPPTSPPTPTSPLSPTSPPPPTWVPPPTWKCESFRVSQNAETLLILLIKNLLRSKAS